MSSVIARLVYGPRAVYGDGGGGNPLDDRYYQMGSGSASRAGVRVSPDAAMKVSTVYRCVSILANMLAMFPKGIYEKTSVGRKDADDHPLDPIISFKPNNRQTAFEFWQLVCFHLVLRQNAYIQIVPGQPGRGWVGQLVPLHPDRIRGPEELPSGRLRYEYTKPDGTKVTLVGGQDIWHLHGLSSDGLKGMSMLDVASDSFGVSISADRHAARFFERGVKFGGILQHEKTLKAETAEAISDSFGAKWGGESGAGKIPVLWEGMKFQPVSMTLKDAEFLDSRKFSVAEIARWFGVPPHMVGDVERSTSWGTGIEVQGLGFLIYSLQPWIEMIEQSIRYALVVQPDTYYAKFNVGAILRMDQKTQAEVFAIMIDKRILNPNECRELLERNPYPGGDEYAKANVPAPAQKPSMPQQTMDNPPPDGVARKLAGRLASELIDEEGRGIGRLALEHARSAEAFRAAVAGFYGRFAGRVAGIIRCSSPAAKAWCEVRRGLVIAGGLAGLTTTIAGTEGQDALTELALANGGDPC